MAATALSVNVSTTCPLTHCPRNRVLGKLRLPRGPGPKHMRARVAGSTGDMGKTDGAVLDVLLDRYGRTYAREAGIRLADRPKPLYQLLVLAKLLSARISAEIAVAAARELFAAGYGTPRAMREASWQDRVNALIRGHYRRYDERTSTMLGEGAELILDRWQGDLRRLRDEAEGDGRRIAALLMKFPGIGPTGADIFLREVQAVWPQVAPYFDQRVLDGAGRLGLPRQAGRLAKLAHSGDELARLSAALIRVSHSEESVDEVRSAATR
ncbi:endonuclease [Nonomuraea antimicrobica]|uniref:Endonuclease n=2 Tax=Nonomuraea antimicrobica TaxID=561173 RepID=A0ABP7C3I5_9ACTN